MKKVIIFLVFCTAMFWSYNAVAQNSNADNRAGYLEVTLEHTWVNCSRSGHIDVRITWESGHFEMDRKYFSNAEGQKFYFTLPDYGPHVANVKIWVSVNDNSTTKLYETNGYVQNHLVAPNPCTSSNGCKRYQNVIICQHGPGGENSTD